MNITIRAARQNDIPSMCDLLTELFTLESDFEPDIEKQQKGLSMLITDTTGSARVLVAVKDGAVIGMATVQTLISTAEGDRVGLVEDVIVDRQFHGSGVGSLLLDRIIAWSRENNLKRLQLLTDRENRPTLAFYSSRGWTFTRLICLRKML
jgi:GNAT superfamily N-acetyltransferase